MDKHDHTNLLYIISSSVLPEFSENSKLLLLPFPSTKKIEMENNGTNIVQLLMDLAKHRSEVRSDTTTTK